MTPTAPSIAPIPTAAKSADMTYDAQVTRDTINRIWDWWTAKPNNVLVPGHDLPMRCVDGEPQFIGNREAAIRAWYGDGLDQTTVVSLTD